MPDVLFPIKERGSGVLWGPDCETIEEFDFPLENIGKYPVARMGRIADFTGGGQKWQNQQRGSVGPVKTEDGYNLVDTKVAKKKGAGRQGFQRPFQRPWQNQWNQGNYQEGILGKRDAKPQPKKQTGRFFNRNNQAPVFKDWSVVAKADWDVVREFALTGFAKAAANMNNVKKEDVKWCGTLGVYEKSMDKIPSRKPMPLKKTDKNFYAETSSADPVLQEMLMDEEKGVDVIATDVILACLMTCSRSVYSWDIVITKMDGKIIFDKRDGSHCDFLTTCETSAEPPTIDEKDPNNTPLKLGHEATLIQQKFTQAVLDSEAGVEKMDEENPFDEEGNAADVAYRYRKITLPGSNPRSEDATLSKDITIGVRTEVHAKQGQSYCAVRCMNEWKKTGGSNVGVLAWRKCLEDKKGAVLASEIKNNQFKLARWAAQASLASCDIVKLGYAVRCMDRDVKNHELLAVQSYSFADLAKQMSFVETNAFGILRQMIETVMEQDDGKFVILKDPVKPVLRLYSVPFNTFEDDDDEEEEDAGNQYYED